MVWDFVTLLAIRCGLICVVLFGCVVTSDISSAGERRKVSISSSRRLPTRTPLYAVSREPIEAERQTVDEERVTPEDGPEPGVEEDASDEDASEEEGDVEEEEEEEDEDDPVGLFQIIPHQVGGLTGESVYTGEVYTNTRGGLNTNGAARYRGNVDLILTGDLEELVGIQGSSFFIYGGDVHGTSLSTQDVGDWQIISDIDPYPYGGVTQMQEYWLRQEILDGQLYFKLGLQDANADFGFSELAGDFINNSFVTIPTIPFPVWPAQSLGISGFAELTDNVTFGAGVYESNKLNGLWGDAVADRKGQIALGHLEWRTQTGPQQQLPGTWRAGAWVDTGQWQEITTAPDSKVFGNNYGFWFSGDQLLFKEEYATDDEQGLGVFCEIGWAPGDRNFLDRYYGAGVVYRGLIPGRDEDNCGVGLADIHFSRQTQARDGIFYETVVELFYKAQVTENLVIQPDLQFIANPGGNGDDALVVGLRFELVL